MRKKGQARGLSRQVSPGGLSAITTKRMESRFRTLVRGEIDSGQGLAAYQYDGVVNRGGPGSEILLGSYFWCPTVVAATQPGERPKLLCRQG